MTHQDAATVDVVVPAGIDDPRHPSGGNRWDRRVIDELCRIGWTVRLHSAPVDVGETRAATREALLRALLPECAHGVPALVDGMLASVAGDVIAALTAVRPVVAVVHMLFGACDRRLEPSERLAVTSVAGIIATSRWTAQQLVRAYAVPAGRIRIACPGADPAWPTHDAARPAGAPRSVEARLLCVGSVSHAKGHDVLVAALIALAAAGRSAWTCACIGPLDTDAPFAAKLRQRIADAGLDDHFTFPGPLSHAMLQTAYADADLLVVSSRGETWGMVVTEALAHGVPVVASDVGGIPEAVGMDARDRRPGILLPVGDSHALAEMLAMWLDNPAVRRRLRAAARARTRNLTGWDATAAVAAAALTSARESWARSPVRLGG